MSAPDRYSRRTLLLAGAAALLAGCRGRGAADALAAVPPPRPAPPPAPPPTIAARQADDALILRPRRAWTDAAIGDSAEPMQGISWLTIHHTGEHLSSSGIDDIDLLQRIDHHHRDGLGWAAIGYHVLIGRDGTCYEGRPERFQGAHCGGDNNRNNLGVSLIGDYQDVMPPPAQLAALRRCIAWARRRHRIPVAHLRGHRDWRATLCPGDHLSAWLGDERRRLAGA